MLEKKTDEDSNDVDWKDIFKLAWQVGPLPGHVVKAAVL
jgi:hypothetical protein